MKKGLNLFGNKKAKRRRREDDFIDYDEQYGDENYEDGYDEEDYPDEEFEEEYGQDVDGERYEDEEYPGEDYPEDDYSEDEEYSDRDYESDEDYDSDYEPERREREEYDTRGERYVEDPESRYEADERYEEEPRFEDDRYTEEAGDRYEDEEYDPEYSDADYAEDEDYDGEYYEDDEYPEDEDYDGEYYEEDYDRDVRGGRGGDRGGRNSRGGRGRDRDGESVGAKILDFVKNTSVAERAAAVVAILLLVGGIATMSFYAQAKKYASEVNSFSEVGTNLHVDGVVGSTGLLAIADAEMARAMTAGIIEEEEEEEVVPDTAENVTIKMTLTTIKSDMKIKFINSQTGKLVANVPFVVSVVTPDGTKVSYDDHDKDGIIYKNNLTAGKYTVTPEALSSDYDSYKLDTSSQSLTIKDTVEMKAVDVSNEIKKESQINAAKEDTAVEVVVESTLTDTVEWVDSNQNDGSSSDGKYKYEVIDKSTITDPSSSSRLTVGSVRRMAAARAGNGNTESLPENSNNENSSAEASTAATDSSTEASTEASTEGSSDASSGGTTDSGSGASTEASTGGSTEASTGGTTDASSSASTQETVQPKDMTVSLTNPSIKVGESTTVNVSISSSFTAKSDNETVATVSGATVTAKAAGTATIKVTADGYKEASATLTVTEADKKNMTLSATSLKLVVGETGKITATGPSAVKYASSDEKVAKVAADGVITAIADGKATITVTADGYNPATAEITVGNKKIEMNVSKVTIVQGQTFKIAPKDTSLTVSYKSADTNIATISGVTITGVNEGKTTITASATGYTDTPIEVTVVNKGTVLKDKNGNVVYVKNSDGNYVEATYNDYYNGSTFYLRKDNDGVRQGWWTIDGKTYYYDKNGNKVTGEQVIKGAKYSFDSNGALSSASGTMGIDVSKWNGNINWNQVKNSGVSYAIIRCGYRGSSAGALIEDPKFKANIQGAQAAGIKVGVYFFSQAVNEVEAVEEASMCINLCSGYSLSMPVYIDVEGSNGRGDQVSASQRTANIKAFCGTIQSAGYKAGVYSNKTWFTQRMNASSLTSYKIWLAQYAASVTYTATRYDMWQYTSKGSISGISGNVDMNILYN